MSSILSSQCLVLATAMAVSSTLVFLAFSRQKTFSPTQLSEKSQKKISLRSCLYSGDKKKRGSKKKKVHFSDEIEESIWESEEVVEKQSKVEISCRNEARCRIPENRVALYNGMLKDRVHRIECSY